MPAGRQKFPDETGRQGGCTVAAHARRARGLLACLLAEEATMLFRVLRYATLLLMLTARERLVRAVRRP